jgi:hypothetical protein
LHSGGAAIAGADDDGGSQAAATPSTAHASRPANGHADEQPLTGDTASRVREAAVARIQGGTIDRLETDSDGHAAYEAHTRNANGEHVTVYVNESFEVVEVEQGR